jgi:tetratricopeptide (TPR) repeat protein
MAIDLCELGQEFAGYYATQRWESAFNRIRELMAEGGETEAFAWVLSADTRFEYATTDAIKALQDLDKAFPVVQSNPALLACACLVGMRIVGLTESAERSARYAKHLYVVSRDESPLALPWHGRAFNAMGARLMSQQEYRRAETCFHKSVEWHRINIGPFNSHDQHCNLRISLTGFGRACLAQGKRTIAKQALVEAESLLKDGTRDDLLHHLRGLILVSKGQDTEALAEYRVAWTASEQSRDHGLRFEIAEAIAESLIQMGHTSELKKSLTPLIRESARAKLPDIVYRLQRLCATHVKKEGALCVDS